MIKDLYWLIILLIFAVFFYYSNKNNNQYLISEGFKNSRVYIGPEPGLMPANELINLNDIDFASHSIYEVGKINYNNNNNDSNKGGPYQNYYSGYFSNYYDNYY